MQDFNSFIQDLSTLISFKTTSSPGTNAAPFGEENKKALDFFLKTAQKFGFNTINYDNYAGEVYFGEGEEIGIIGHLDVVPTGIGWDSDPYTLTFKDGFYIARGIMDDKGPSLMSLYALKELKESGIKFNKKIRLFVGCNEETGWKDVEYLKTKTTIPEYGFSPDGNFPVCYAEKGMYVVEFLLPKLKNFHSIEGGTVINAVCDYAKVIAKDAAINLDLLNKHGLKLKDNNVIESFGKAAHGSNPHLGVNALKPLLNYLLEMGEDVKDAIEYLFNDKGNLKNLKNEQGSVTFSPDLICEKGEKMVISCDCRVPAPLGKQDIVKVFDKFNIPYNITEKHPPMMVEKQDFFVKTLTNSYNQIMGKNEDAQSMGGCSFARLFKKGCAFGPDFKTYETNIHDANERVMKEDLIKAYEIYVLALKDLVK